MGWGDGALRAKRGCACPPSSAVQLCAAMPSRLVGPCIRSPALPAAGTNDNHRLLPLAVRQHPAVEPRLRGTNGHMLAVLLGNPRYDTLAPPQVRCWLVGRALPGGAGERLPGCVLLVKFSCRPLVECGGEM